MPTTKFLFWLQINFTKQYLPDTEFGFNSNNKSLHLTNNQIRFHYPPRQSTWAFSDYAPISDGSYPLSPSFQSYVRATKSTRLMVGKDFGHGVRRFTNWSLWCPICTSSWELLQRCNNVTLLDDRSLFAWPNESRETWVVKKHLSKWKKPLFLWCMHFLFFFYNMSQHFYVFIWFPTLHECIHYF